MQNTDGAAPMAHASRLDLVQTLRGLAAFAVLTHHIAVAVDDYFGRDFTPLGVGLGWVGVDVFFVLSGFIMVWTTRDAGHGLRPAASFWTRRALRVYPPYWAATALAFGVTLLVPAIGSGHGGGDWLHSLTLLPAAAPPFLNPGWTLIYELWFYLGFGFLMLAPRRFLPALLAGWAFAVIVGALRFGAQAGPILHVAINPLTLNFLMGAGVALGLGAWRGALSPRLILAIALCGCLGLLAGAFIVSAVGWNDWTRMAACGPASAVLLTGAALADRAGLMRPPQALVTLGDWSYALYLTHQPLIFAIAAVSVQAFGVGWTGVAVTYLVGAILPFPFAWALHKLVELPAQTWGRSAARWIKP